MRLSSAIALFIFSIQIGKYLESLQYGPNAGWLTWVSLAINFALIGMWFRDAWKESWKEEWKKPLDKLGKWIRVIGIIVFALWWVCLFAVLVPEKRPKTVESVIGDKDTIANLYEDYMVTILYSDGVRSGFHVAALRESDIRIDNRGWLFSSDDLCIRGGVQSILSVVKTGPDRAPAKKEVDSL